jgi:predicted nucleic acid-binding protein
MAARLKARGNISYSDCFAAALGQLKQSTVITGDPEFKRVENQVKVRWLSS